MEKDKNGEDDPTLIVAPSVESTTPHTETPVLPPTRKRIGNRAKVSLALLILALIAAAVWYFTFYKNNPVSNMADQSSSAGHEEEPEPEKESIPRTLYEASGNTQGIAIGYVKKARTAESAGVWAPKKVFADKDTYETTLFFIRGEQLYSYNVESREEKQISEASEAGVGTPVFSTVSQTIAYKCTCGLVVKSVSDPAANHVVHTARTNYKPVAWSPDGQKLLVSSTNDADPDEFGLLKLNLYSLADNKVTKLDSPEGYNSLTQFSNITWEKANNVLVEFADKTLTGDFTQRSWFSLDTDKGVHTLRTDIDFENLEAVRYTSTQLFVPTKDTPVLLRVSPLDNLNENRIIPGTEGISSNYLIRQDTVSQEAIDVIISMGEPGTENSFTFKRVPIDAGEPEVLHKPGGFSAFLLGWKHDYSSFMYLSYRGDNAEIHEFDITERADKVVLDKLDFIQ